MGKNEAKKQLKELYGCKCFLTDLKAMINYHHTIYKKCNGGQETVNNGTLINREIHDYLHSLEQSNKELYNLINECLIAYKVCLEQGRTDCLEIWEEVQELARQKIRK